jgi:ABC-type multidrug transport system fused ATPase/permease subunit
MVLEKGRILEMGSHEDLVHKENGVYAGMLKMQSFVQGHESA